MVAIYPGSFNPFHDGHLEILKKAKKIFDKIYLVVSKNILKDENPNLDARIIEINKKIANLNGIEIITNQDKLTADLARELNVEFIVRGVRDKNDLEYEMEISDANKTINKNLETVIFIADNDERKISSTRLKEIESYREK